MIIQAMARFACEHRYVAHVDTTGVSAGDAVDPKGLVLLVCERCGHRAEQLPLPRDKSFGRVIAFPMPAPTPRYVQTLSDRYTDPPPLLTA